ncbi:tRNA1(Val) (adenine(37)-N6)-methyltransferase [Mycoplasmopsis cynos]|nr:tRNA1(Val) (adenine(37)-N6)-methyltransferase [Mycoplasmopsis cynos]MCU9933368.1 tRNA1(Val) (adenine(37)-N6)-methyltransferase [Mycoplasmopsis cynos]MCU9934847.1 tRNA1(Val) (adenine(37)-N6)-methyltransferase [Mycoplasmopsis cynos]UWV85905.1 tRNA1(Val) (adenine(37)-N6)-methyltransferase [Mycoplasmopsis cynos]WQQ15004.1 tRNA1(Val) (adenine(37)-N6)-methyltransferase [Mycoplasmopsis cynos]WQQ15485.1 tRNA1(Val) (adenine(37)-N6)-methyltransferase [Mycoplasmopsis cynos]
MQDELFKNRNIVKNSLGFDSDLYVFQDKNMFNYSVDTILLGNFIYLNHKIKNVLEIGTNNAALAIFVASRNKELKIDAVEIQKKAADLAKYNVKFNNLESQINIINQDFNNFWVNHTKTNAKKYQSIFCNPPFYEVDKIMQKTKVNNEVLIATFEIALTLENLIYGASKIIEQKGFLSLVLPVERSIDAFVILKKYNFEPKRIQFVYPRADQKPKFILLEARYQTGSGPHFLKNIYLHSQDDRTNHEYLPEVKELYKPIKV